MRPKVGLALGAGGAKGLAHIGVLQVLREANISIDFITGSSMGAAIGAMYCAGADLDILEKLAKEVRNMDLIDIGIPKLGLIKGRKALSIARLMTHNKDFCDLNIPLRIVATDLNSGTKVVFKEGKVADAVRASISVPGVVEPYCIDDRILVDGAVTDTVPAQLVKEMGADLVIAVDLQFYNHQSKAVINNVYDVIMQSLEILEGPKRGYYYQYADVIIPPKVGKYSWTNFEVASQMIQLGKEACREALPAIKMQVDCFNQE